MISKMNLTRKRRMFYYFLAVIILGMAFSSCNSSPVQSVPTAAITTTAVQYQHIQAFMEYTARLEDEGLVAVKDIQVEGSQPFIFILKRENSPEITEQDVQNVTELVLKTVSVFESRRGLRDGDIDIAFHRPVGQKILLIKQDDMPELLSEDAYNEMTVSLDNAYFTSLVNLAGSPKNGRQDFADAWAVIQAVCIAYAGDFADADPVCNIISANAAAGWVGIEQEEAAKIINNYGMTKLAYLGNKDHQYRFIGFVYEEYAQ